MDPTEQIGTQLAQPTQRCLEIFTDTVSRLLVHRYEVHDGSRQCIQKNDSMQPNDQLPAEPRSIPGSTPLFAGAPVIPSLTPSLVQTEV